MIILLCDVEFLIEVGYFFLNATVLNYKHLNELLKPIKYCQ